MKYSIPVIIATSMALMSLPVFASRIQGTDIEASTHLTMKQCLRMQGAKNDGASQADMERACRWTGEATSSMNSLSSSEKPAPVDLMSYENLPSALNPPH